jgi:hypothetical protein
MQLRREKIIVREKGVYIDETFLLNVAVVAVIVNTHIAS